ncbi:Recombination protein O [Sedimentisphaera cyanobacteriorum]|uniref:DNA repair protein RecO n=1 Tax=Sedimentisphaera cyanobacteriorum TaxID=1940790 RepID=A0A1Q2HSH6_9BACT|nr:DNA repair protein RecO [Sedimentisphaera cyanobacteriorum]AQQ10224.1 Recombination protein O [Sedimentisphaera cyanobacteriorum]
MPVKDTAVCIRKVDYSDSSLILTLFARDNGKLRLIAKGARKTKGLAGNIEIFTLGEAVFIPAKYAESNLGTLTDFDITEKFHKIRKSWAGLNFSLCAADLLSYFVNEYQPNPELYDGFIDFLNAVSTAGELAAAKKLILFQLDMLELTGNSINISLCSACGRNFDSGWKEAFFSETDVSLYCPDCKDKAREAFPLKPAAVWAILERDPIGSSEDGEMIWYIEKFILKYITCHLGKMPKTVQSLKRHFEKL